MLSRQIFEDAPAVISYINQRLPYMVKFKEDNELLNGSGTWPDITGFLNTSNVLSQSFSTDMATTLALAISQVEDHDGAPSAVIMNPVDAWNMFSHRASTSGVFDFFPSLPDGGGGAPAGRMPLSIWGIPTYRSRAYPQGSALVLDAALAAMIFDRESVNVQIYRERYADLNQILLVCEERMASPHSVRTWFAKPHCPNQISGGHLCEMVGPPDTCPRVPVPALLGSTGARGPTLEEGDPHAGVHHPARRTASAP